jgi:Holliday junction resolvase RusA-like endonuclease
MEYYEKIKPILEGLLAVAIGWNFIYSVFKRDLNNFLKVLAYCAVALYFVEDPQALVEIIKAIVGFALSIFKGA